MPSIAEVAAIKRALAYSKFARKSTCIGILVSNPAKSRRNNWVSECSRWLNKYAKKETSERTKATLKRTFVRRGQSKNKTIASKNGARMGA